MSIWHFACHVHTYEYHYPARESMVRRYSCASISCFGGTKAVSTGERQSDAWKGTRSCVRTSFERPE